MLLYPDVLFKEEKKIQLTITKNKICSNILEIKEKKSILKLYFYLF